MEIRVLRYFLAVAREGKYHCGCQFPSPVAAHPVETDQGSGRRTGCTAPGTKKPQSKPHP